MKKYIKYLITLLLFFGILFVNIEGVNATCLPGDPGYPYCNSTGGGSTNNSTKNACDKCIADNPANSASACYSVCHKTEDGNSSDYCKQHACTGSAADFNNPCCAHNSAGTNPDDNADGNLTDDAHDVSEAQKFCYDNFKVGTEEWNRCIVKASSNPDSNSDDEKIDKIKEWAQKNGYDNIDSVGDPCQIIDDNLKKLLNYVFWFICVSAIILLVIMTAVSFVKAILGADDEKLKDAFKHLVTRIIVVIILLLLPAILTFIVTLINNNAGGEVSIGKDGNVFCDITK